MNKSLNALLTKLTWQQDELSEQLKQAENKSEEVINHLQNLEKKLNKNQLTPLIINPDLEINRLNFIAHQQEKKEELSMILKNYQNVETQLKEKIVRIKTELKMLEKYREREKQAMQKCQKKIQENQLEEWVLQKGNYDEN